MSDNSVNISTKITESMRDALDKLAKEYNVTRSEMMRILIVGVVDDNLEDIDIRPYPRREHQGVE